MVVAAWVMGRYVLFVTNLPAVITWALYAGAGALRASWMPPWCAKSACAVTGTAIGTSIIVTGLHEVPGHQGVLPSHGGFGPGAAEGEQIDGDDALRTPDQVEYFKHNGQV